MISVKILTRSAAALGVTGALALLASPAMADSGGAVVNRQSECRTDAYGTICSTLDLVTNKVTPRNGDTIYVYNLKATDSYYRLDGTSTGTIDFAVHYHTLLAPDGSVMENGYHGTTTSTNEAGTCIGSADIHYAHGTYQYYDTSHTCTP